MQEITADCLHIVTLIGSDQNMDDQTLQYFSPLIKCFKSKNSNICQSIKASPNNLHFAEFSKYSIQG